MNTGVQINRIKEKIYIFRGQRVMLSTDLAILYGVEVRALIQAVKRNIDRFPQDFMFQLTWDEVHALGIQGDISETTKRVSPRSQNVILKRGSNVKYLPYAFTEQGVAMLSSVLRSKRAVQVNIIIMRAFVKIREIVSAHKELLLRLDKLEEKVGRHDKEIQAILNAIRQLMAPPPQKKKEPIGFRSRKS